MPNRTLIVILIITACAVVITAGYLSEKQRFDPDLTSENTSNKSEPPNQFNTNYSGLAVLSPMMGDSRPSSVPLEMIALENGKAGLADKNGKVVLKTNFDWIGKFYNGLAIVGIIGDQDQGGTVNDQWGYINETGKIVIPLKYNLAFSFSEGLAPVRVERGRFGFLDTHGKVAIEALYGDVEEFSDGVAQVELNKEWVFINHKGEKVKRNGRVE